MSAFLILAVSIYFSSNKIVIEFAAKSFNSMISSASYHAVDALIEKKYKYSDLVDIKTDNDGKISMVVTDSYEVNKLAAIVATNAYDYLSGEIVKGVEVPVGAFTGGLAAASAGVTAAVVFGYIIALIFKAISKKN